MLSPELYDDGGFSGGNMQRPGLAALMAEVEAGRVQVIVVYKVDRLTRSLADFAKINEVLDAKGASFVSVTQSFNTTTSMGRLTLNVLLSFAQFEREVTGERIRDKIAASKKKGMWMGGPVPLGYDVRDRKLVINDAEAATVRHIFERYLACGSIVATVGALARDDIVTKVTWTKEGRQRGGIAWESWRARSPARQPRLYRRGPPPRPALPRRAFSDHSGEVVGAGSKPSLPTAGSIGVHPHNLRHGNLLGGILFDGLGRADADMLGGEGQPDLPLLRDLRRRGSAEEAGCVADAGE